MIRVQLGHVNDGPTSPQIIAEATDHTARFGERKSQRHACHHSESLFPFSSLPLCLYDLLNFLLYECWVFV